MKIQFVKDMEVCLTGTEPRPVSVKKDEVVDVPDRRALFFIERQYAHPHYPEVKMFKGYENKAITAAETKSDAVDLKALSKDELRALGKEHGLKFGGRTSEDKMREQLVEVMG